MDEEDKIEVSISFMQSGPDGPGWYAWEAEYPEEGYFWVSAEKPTDAQLKEICPNYFLI
jgi:hypothetical protein